MITEAMVTSHGLSQEEYQNILKILGREPNINELGIFSVMWSEHCSYKSSRIYLKNFPTTGKQVLQGPGENAGVIDIGDNDAIAFKMESHNHPSFIEPYQGAATGVGGILRDVFTMGARPIANLDALRFGEVTQSKTAHLVTGVVAGIAGYGNCMGVPTVGGDVGFEACYNGNILVNAMTVGYLKSDKIFKGYASGVGNPVFYVGAKTGRDGIHGATMASGSFDDSAQQQRPTVQVGDPFTEKLLLEACLELMNLDVIVGIQDMGAAGLTSSSFEMASRAGTGIKMDLTKIPLRETRMTPYEILLSESQERMLMVVQKGQEELARSVFVKWGLDVAEVGIVTDTGRMVIEFQNEVVVDLPIAPLANNAPVYERPLSAPKIAREAVSSFTDPKPFAQRALLLLAEPELASKKWIYRQFDATVQTNTLVGPGFDAALVRIENSSKAVSLRVGCNSRYVYLNPFMGSQIAVAECGRNIVCSGATPLAITDCLNFGNPQNPEIMWEFAQSCQGIATACNVLNTPVVSGNVSLYNETNGQSIFPTPMIGMVGLIKDYKKAVGNGFKNVGDVIILLGETKNEWGGSAWQKQVVAGNPQGFCPTLCLETEKTLWCLVQNLATQSLISSAHDVSEGGLWMSLCEAGFYLQNGFRIEIESSLKSAEFLFSESQSRILLSVTPENVKNILPLLKDSGVPYTFLGDVVPHKVSIRFNREMIIDSELDDLNKIYVESLVSTVFRT